MNASLNSVFQLILMMIWVSCDDGYPTDNKLSQLNRNPGSFNVSVSDITQSSATLTWTMAIDPDDEVVTYNVEIAISPVELANSPKVTSLEITELKLKNLLMDQTYYGKVVALDPEGGMSHSSFDFITKDN